MIRIEKTPLNIWTLIALAVTMVLNAFGAGVLYNQFNNRMDGFDAKLASESAARMDRSLQVDNTLQGITAKMPTITQLEWNGQQLANQLQELRKANEQTNERLTRFVETNNAKLDGLVSNVNDIRLSVSVIATKLDVQTPSRKQGLLFDRRPQQQDTQ